jgi:hypothetical protein
MMACAVPDSCERMCEASADAWADCAAAQPLGWQSTPFHGPDDQREGCDTWVWEQRQLDADLGATCARRAGEFNQATCEQFD